MRMTRAALRAQEAEDELSQKLDHQLKEQGLSSQSSIDTTTEYIIHEDSDKENTSSFPVNDKSIDNSEVADRPILRDITAENYPNADASNVADDATLEPQDTEGKPDKKAKGKKGRKGGKKHDAKMIDQPVDSQPGPDKLPEPINESEEVPVVDSTADTLTGTLSLEPEQIDSEEHSHSQQDDIPQSQDTVQGAESPPTLEKALEDISSLSTGQKAADAPSGILSETPAGSSETLSKTPKFNPQIHLSPENNSDGNTEDSFVESIKTRSPSKLSQSLLEKLNKERSDSFVSNRVSRTPSKTYSQTSSPGSQRVEDSVEAIDALEDAIEKFTEDLPVLEGLRLESPVKSRKAPAKTPTKATAVSPTRPTITKTPVKLASPKLGTTIVDKTVEVRTPQALKTKTTPVKGDLVKERMKAFESKPSQPTHRRTTSAFLSKRDATQSKPTTNARHTATKSVSSVAPNAASSMSFSASPVKPVANTAAKRNTSGSALVTSKPAFVPAKSTKPTTKSTFTLPGEAIAAKLKAQREERQKREEAEAEKKPAFKARPAPSKTSRPSVIPRENKASVARLHTRKASGENKENVAPVRPISSTATTTKSSTATKSKPVTATTSSSTRPPAVRRTTIAPKPSSTVESRKAGSDPSTTSTQTSQRITSLTSGQPSAVSKADAAQQRLKGKEVYDRIKGTRQIMEEDKKAKEEAAKKARAEAAERGRQASREWAEKQKAKQKAAIPAAGVDEKKAVVATVTAVV